MSGLPGFTSLSPFFTIMERARALDPDAFKPTYLPHFSADQEWRQRLAIEKAQAGETRSAKTTGLARRVSTRSPKGDASK